MKEKSNKNNRIVPNYFLIQQKIQIKVLEQFDYFLFIKKQLKIQEQFISIFTS